MGAHGQLPEGRALPLSRRRAVRLTERRLGARAAALAGAALLAACGSAHAGRARSGARARAALAGVWESPATLSACGGGQPRILFPTKEPDHPSGPGAILWNAGSSCAEGAGARIQRLGGGPAPVGADVSLGAASAPMHMLTAAASPHGEIAVLAAPESGQGEAGVIQGLAGGPFAALGLPGGLGSPWALSTAWLGDLAIAAPASGAAGQLNLHVERFFSHSFIRNQPVDAAGTPPQALSVALDYRTDALAAWAAGGYLYARELPGRGGSKPIQRIARVAGRVAIASLLSDDYRGILAWSERSSGRTKLYLDQSAVGVQFGSPRLLQSSPTPAGPAPEARSPQLIRLASESVMLAWAAPADGKWSVRTAAIDQNGIGQATTISPPGQDALLSDLVPGPAGEAIALWTEPEPASGGGSQAERSIFAAPGVDARPDITIFGAPEEVAPPGPLSEATAGVEPATGKAIAVWRDAGAGLRYAIRPGAGR